MATVNVKKGLIGREDIEHVSARTDGTQTFTRAKSDGSSQTLTKVNLWQDNVYNVVDYGAEGDGTTDDTVAIQNAIDAAATAGKGGIVWFPPGTYQVTSINLTDKEGIILQGVGSAGYDTNSAGASILKGSDNTKDVLSIAGDDEAGVRNHNLTLRGLVIENGKNGIAFTNFAVWMFVEDVHVSSPVEACILVQGYAQQFFFRNLDLEGGKYGMDFQHSLGTNTGPDIGENLLDKSTFSNIRCSGQSGAGARGLRIHTHLANSVQFNNLTVNHCAEHGIDLGGGISGLVFNGVNFERNAFGQGHTTETAIYDNITSVDHNTTYSESNQGNPGEVVVIDCQGSSGVGGDTIRFDINAEKMTHVTVIGGGFVEPIYDPEGRVSVFGSNGAILYGRYNKLATTGLRTSFPQRGGTTTLQSPQWIRLPIFAVTTGAGGTFVVKGEGDLSKLFGDGSADRKFRVEGSTNNDQEWTADAVSFDGGTGEFTITVAAGETVGATPDGDIFVGGDLELTMQKSDTDGNLGNFVMRVDNSNRDQVFRVDAATRDCYVGNTLYMSNGPTASADRGIFIGDGTPEGVVTAAIGSLFMRRDGGAGTSLYVKESGTGNTGWVAK